MSRHQLVLNGMSPYLATGLILLAGLSGCAPKPPAEPGSPEANCGPKVQVDVTVKDGTPQMEPADARAHVGDKVHWVFHGSEAKEFKVMFTSVTNSPFEWSEKKGASVSGCVKDDALKNGHETPYPYNVDVDGASRDPMIIIEPRH